MLLKSQACSEVLMVSHVESKTLRLLRMITWGEDETEEEMSSGRSECAAGEAAARLADSEACRDTRPGDAANDLDDAADTEEFRFAEMLFPCGVKYDDEG